MPKKPLPSTIPTKKPTPLLKPIPPVPLAVIRPVKPGQATGKVSRPSPVAAKRRRK
jgi:hypothetical protein